MGYRIYVSDSSRGWNYVSHHAEKDVWQYIGKMYRPDQWGKAGTVPIGSRVYESQTPEIVLDLGAGSHYISICAVDEHAKELGINGGLFSSEIQIEIQ